LKIDEEAKHKSSDEDEDKERPMVNYTNILPTTFLTISFDQKITNPKCKYMKASQNTSVTKKLTKKSTKNSKAKLYICKHVPTFYNQLLFSYNLALLFFVERIMAQKLLVKCW